MSTAAPESSAPNLSLRHQPILQDRISVIAIALSVILNIITLVVLFARLHHTDYQVPIHYSSLVGFDQVGAWYVNYQIGFFALAVTAINVALAAKSFRRNRLASFFLLIGSVVVSVLCLVVGVAFAVVV